MGEPISDNAVEQITKADLLRMSRPLQNRAKRAHESPQVTNNGKYRATLRRLSSTVLFIKLLLL
jgi:hypothetical protein